ncbi:MAG: hypothetical protein HYU66_13915, partial [Armatimonadetes bacterium]|nr:hypothetical protein [Armatimonadota bacterium]
MTDQTSTTWDLDRRRGRAAWYLTLAFCLVSAGVPLAHVARDFRRGESDWAQLRHQAPTGESLKAFAQTLADNSPVARTVRPWTQWLGTRFLGRGNAKTVVGGGGWLFYRASVDHVVGPPADPDGPARAIVAYRDALARQGIRLVVLAVPGKETVYPELLAPGYPAALGPPRNAGTVRLIEALRHRGVEVVDPVTVLSGLPAAGSRGYHAKPTSVGSGSGVGAGRLGMVAAASSRRAPTVEPLYLPQDTHWSPTGLGLVVDEVARRIESLGWLRGCPAVPYAASPEPASVANRGDLYDMLDLPADHPLGPPFPAFLRPVMLDGEPWRPDHRGAVMLLGDS